MVRTGSGRIRWRLWRFPPRPAPPDVLRDEPTRAVLRLRLNQGAESAISAGFTNYLNFRGRAFRSEYWFWVFFYILGAVITFIIDLVLEVEESNGMFSSVTATPTISC